MLLRKVKILLPIVGSNGMSTTAAVITHLSLCPMHWAVDRPLLHAPNAVVGESCSSEELVDRLSKFGGQEFSAITAPHAATRNTLVYTLSSAGWPRDIATRC
jgi:hypothetical protein